MTRPPLVCCIGDLVEDVVALLAGPPRRGTDTSATVVRRRGGSAANVAVAAAAAGVRARFVGRVGADGAGATLAADLEASGVEVCVQRAGRTGTIVVLVEPGGERTMLADRAASTELLDPPVGWVDGAAVLHVPAYSLVVDPLASSARSLAAAARRDGACISVDASSVAVLEAFGLDAVAALLAQVRPDVLFANAEEAAVLGLDCGPVPSSTLVVVKQGPAPVVLRSAGGDETVPVPALDGVADTTGAGDVFAGAFLAATAQGAPPGDAARAGILAARRLLESTGSRAPTV